MRRQVPWTFLVLCLACSSPAPEDGTAGSSESGQPLRIYLARHGRTTWNAERRLQGQSDTHLDETGRKQASQLAEFMRPIRLDAVYSSTLSRSRETAEAIGGSAPLIGLDGLREQRLGKFEGLHLEGGDSVLVAEFWRRLADPQDDLDGGESAEQHFQRVRESMNSIRQRHPSGTILIVGHGGTNRMILRELLNLTMEQADSIHQANDEVYLVELEVSSPPRLWKRITLEHLSDL